MKIIKKLIYSLFLILVVTFSSGIIASIIYKEEIINLLIIEINKKIRTELEVDKIDLKILRGFPNISIDFQGVKFYSAFTNEILLESKHVYFELDIFGLFSQHIKIDKLEIIDAHLNIHVNKDGQRNFDVFVPSDSSKYAVTSLDLKSVLFKNVKVSSKLDNKGVSAESYITSLQGGLFINKDLLEVKVLSDLIILKTDNKPLEWLVGKQIKLNTKNLFVGDHIEIDKSTITIEKMQLTINGMVGIDTSNKIDLGIEASNLNFEDIRSVLPEKAAQKLKMYSGKGNIDVNAKVDGSIGVDDKLRVFAKVDLQDFEINSKRFTHRVKHINVSSELSIPDLSNLNSSTFKFNKLSASIDNKRFSANMSLVNFNAPKISGAVTGKFDVSWLLSFTDIEFNNAQGNLDVDISGNVGFDDMYELKTKNILGKLGFNNVQLDSLFGISFSLPSGDVAFGMHQIEFKKVSAKLGTSDMVLNGEVNLANDNSQRIYSKLQVSSKHINLDEIFRMIKTSKGSIASSTSSQLKYSSILELTVKRLNFLKFRGKDLRINLGIDENEIRVKSSSATALGGLIKFSGVGSQQFNGDYYIRAQTQTKHIFIDSLFYVFGNFKQSFITSEAIKGKLDANINAQMYFDTNWNLRRKLLYSEAFLRIKEGELTNYKPVMSLSSYLNEEDENLAQLKFSDLENHIIIANDTVFISEMYVGTNIRNIKIGGYHTLNQRIDYRLAVPVINANKDSDSHFGKVKKDNKGHLYMPFRVFGTTADYKVVYDVKTAGSNFFKGIKKEFKEIGKKKDDKLELDSLELEEDEYFDWDNN